MLAQKTVSAFRSLRPTLVFQGTPRDRTDRIQFGDQVQFIQCSVDAHGVRQRPGATATGTEGMVDGRMPRGIWIVHRLPRGTSNQNQQPLKPTNIWKKKEIGELLNHQELIAKDHIREHCGPLLAVTTTHG